MHSITKQIKRTFTQRAATAKTQDAKKDTVNVTKETSHALINANANNARMTKFIHHQSLKTNANIIFFKFQKMLHFKSIMLLMIINNIIKIALMIVNSSKIKKIKMLIN